MADAADLNSAARKGVRVRTPAPVPHFTHEQNGGSIHKLVGRTAWRYLAASWQLRRCTIPDSAKASGGNQPPWEALANGRNAP